MWVLGKGTNWLLLRKSKTLWPSRSVTMQMWLRKSKVSRRWMHLLRLDWSLHASVESTRNSMREASRYFCTERIILMATSACLLRSQACTTLPNVPWPSSRTIESVEPESERSETRSEAKVLTSLGQVGVFLNNVVSVIIIHFLVARSSPLQPSQ